MGNTAKKWLQELFGEVERLRAVVDVLQSRHVCALLDEIAQYAREGHLGEFERLVITADGLDEIVAELDGVLGVLERSDTNAQDDDTDAN